RAPAPRDHTPPRSCCPPPPPPPPPRAPALARKPPPRPLLLLLRGRANAPPCPQLCPPSGHRGSRARQGPDRQTQQGQRATPDAALPGTLSGRSGLLRWPRAEADQRPTPRPQDLGAGRDLSDG